MSSTAPSEAAVPTAPRRPARAEHVGSLLRPEKLKALVEEIYEPGHSALLEEERAKDLSALHSAEDEAIRAAVRAADLDPPSDVHASREYRRHLAEVLAVRAARQAQGS
jgi:hypothetical protein